MRFVGLLGIACFAAGGLEQPQYGLPECADLPEQTPFTRFHPIALMGGSGPDYVGDFINATPILSVEIFYCTDRTTAFFQPFRCVPVR